MIDWFVLPKGHNLYNSSYTSYEQNCLNKIEFALKLADDLSFKMKNFAFPVN